MYNLYHIVQISFRWQYKFRFLLNAVLLRTFSSLSAQAVLCCAGIFFPSKQSGSRTGEALSFLVLVLA